MLARARTFAIDGLQARAVTVEVDIRGKLLEARVVEPPFVHREAQKGSQIQTKGST